MKKLFTLSVLLLAFFANAMAWEPVIKERHWFGLKEFESELYPSPGVGPTQSSVNVNGSGELTSITLHRDWSGGPTGASSFNCWMDDSGDSPKPRFRFNASYNWEIGMNNNSNYSGYGLKVKDLGNAGGTIIHIQHLNNGDKLVFETYLVPGSDNIMYMPFLEEGSIEGVPALNYASEWSWNGENNIGIADGVSREYLYTGSNDGTVSIKFPSNAVIRCITIIYNEENYQKATTRVDPIRDAQNNLGYEMTITGSGVLEDKRGAVPYLTMRYGDMNDMTFSKYLGTVGGEKQYGTFSIVDETAPLNPGSVELQTPYRQRSEAQNQKSLVGKEITVFTENENLSDQSPAPGQESPRFNSIYPLYGNYFYFFPEVDGKFHVKFYCEGEAEMMCMWYKLDGNGDPVPIAQQNSSNLMMSTDGGNSWTGPLFGGGNSTLNQNYYEYTADFKKGGVYYLCSNPTIQTQQSPIPRLISYSFIPSFRVDPLYNVVDNGTTECTNMAQVYGGVFSDLNGDVPLDNIIINGESAPRVKCLGNVASAQPYFYTEGGVQRLGFKNITYKYKAGDDTSKPINKGGAIVVNVRCSAGQATFVLTIAYKAAEAEWGKDADGKDARMGTNDAFVKRWDFFSGKGDAGDDWDLGKYSNTSSKLYKETHKADGLTADWMDTYVNLKDEEERIFKSVYDMEGDNADMIHETAGLLFHTESNLLGVYNENAASTSSFADRYIGFMGPEDLPLDNGDEQHARALTIPRLTAGDRIAIKMGTYGNSDDDIETQQAILKITGAQDAVGTAITGDYKIGGSGVNAGNDTNSGEDITDKSQPWGEYHFISTGGDFTLEVKEADLLKIYSIVIYRNAKNDNADILTENELLGDEDKRQILNTQDFTSAADNVQLHMHYRGLNEATNYAQMVPKTGNLEERDLVMSDMTSAGSLWYTYMVNLGSVPFTPDKAKFGVFKVRQGVKTIGEDYVTDYADCMIPVGYRETKTYPYTWDFTDLKKYVSSGVDSDGTELEVADADADLRIWDEWNLRVTPEEWDGNIFVSGGQLYGGKTMIDETRGLGITHDDNNVTTMTGTTTDETGGLAVGDGAYGFIVPQLDKSQAVYVRAHKVGDTQDASYEKSDGTTSYAYGQSEQEFTYHTTANDGSGDEVFAMVMPSDLSKKADVRLNFKGYEVKKIAVSDYAKKVNKLGFASESRDKKIDPELMAYMTGTGLKAYYVSDVDYSGTTPSITLTAVEKGSLIGAATEGDHNAYIIYNPEKKAVSALNDGFHLFVPDMHDEGNDALDLSGNLLVSNLTDDNPIAQEDGDYTNYLMNYIYKDARGNQKQGPEAFYRAGKGAKLGANKAYLQLLTEKVKPSYLSVDNHAKFAIIFVNEEEGTETTALDGVQATEMLSGDNAIYTLSGVKVSNPQKGVVYVKNGKKYVIK